MKKRERPSFRRPRYPYAAVPTRQVKPSEGPADRELPDVQCRDRGGPYVVEWQLDDSLSTNKPAYTRQ